MKINRQFQDLHMPDGGESEKWIELQCVERDICLLYHQLAHYSWIMGDLYYGDVYALPYWEYLNVPNVEPERQKFIRNGCLVMLYAMASGELDGSGIYLTTDRQVYLAARTAVEALPSLEDDTNRLIAAVRGSLRMIGENRRLWDDASDVKNVFAESHWIHERFVRPYFIGRANDFATNPYFQSKEQS
jgi:hypothetical protein